MLYVQATPSKNKPTVDTRRDKGMKKTPQPTKQQEVIGDYCGMFEEVV